MTRRHAFIAAAALVTLGACGDDGSPQAAELAPLVITTSTTLAPTTTSSTTTTSTTTTSTTTTTTTIAPTTVPLPVPEAAPANPRAPEKRVGLGTIEIPKIGVSKNLFEGVTLTTLDRGPGHWPGTAMPGRAGNVVVGGHRTSHDRPFRNVDQLVPGDLVIFTTVDGRFVYNVTYTEIVYPDAIWIINQTADATATLFACHPVGSTRQRIIIHLALVA